MGQTMAYVAAREGQYGMLALLLDLKADPSISARVTNPPSPLPHLSCTSPLLALSRTLPHLTCCIVWLGCLTLLPQYGLAPAHVAALRGEKGTLSLLLDWKAQVNAVDAVKQNQPLWSPLTKCSC